MPRIRTYAEVDTWTVDDLIDACSPNPSSNKKVTIPEFQRRLVWSKDKQIKLIESIKKGYPFGSLLLYEDNLIGEQNNAKRQYKLIDGLQRTQALRKYVDRPNTFFSREDIPDEFVKDIERSLNNLGLDRGNIEIQSSIIKWIRSLKGFSEPDGWGSSGLINALVTDLLDVEKDSQDFYVANGKLSTDGLLGKALADFLQQVRQDADISKAKIPVVIYTGPTSELPTVFELLNSQGTALSRYEIFAAQWIDKRSKIKNRKIIEAIWRKYEALEDEGFTLDVTEETPDSRSRRDREYTLFEYLFGLGQFLSSNYKHLFKVTYEDKPSSAGFNLVSACLGLQVKDMDRLPNYINKHDRDELETKILTCVKFIDDTLKQILQVRQKNGKVSIYHSEFQIISFIATAFQTRYDIDNTDSPTLEEINGWKANWERLKDHNILMFYLYDILRDYWRGSGDSKLQDTLRTKRYLNKPPRVNSWKQVIDTWFSDNQITLAHSRRYVRDATPEILLLKYIYASQFSLLDNAKIYDIEHIIPVEQLTKIMAKNDKWPINAISNLALLESGENRSKKDKTFKEYLDLKKKQLHWSEQTLKEKLQDSQKQLLCPTDLLPIEVTKASFEEFLIERFQYLKDKFLESWSESITPDNT